MHQKVQVKGLFVRKHNLDLLIYRTHIPRISRDYLNENRQRVRPVRKHKNYLRERGITMPSKRKGIPGGTYFQIYIERLLNSCTKACNASQTFSKTQVVFSIRKCRITSCDVGRVCDALYAFVTVITFWYRFENIHMFSYRR